jgi:hypothetical protein
VYAITPRERSTTLAMPTTTQPPTPAGPATMAMCLRHADYHAMGSECWSATLDWFFDHSNLPDQDARDLYQGEVERAILDQYIRAHQEASR